MARLAHSEMRDGISGGDPIHGAGLKIPVDPDGQNGLQVNTADSHGEKGDAAAKTAIEPATSHPTSVIYNEENSDNGTVEFRNAAGQITGTMKFSNIENIIVCFTPGTTIATPRGERLVEDLKVGDKVITRDNGLQEIRWMGIKKLDLETLTAQPHLSPVLVQAGSLGHGLPERDMTLSPNHRVLVANDRTALYFEEREVLVSAKHLVNNKGVKQIKCLGVNYIHFMFDNHEVVLSNGAWSESFQPGDYTLHGMGNSQRSEIFELFPELKTPEGISAYQSARKTLKKHEARLIVD